MALLDRCIFTPVSAGSADFVVSNPVAGFQTPAQAGAISGQTYSYVASSSDNTFWELGRGTYTVTSGIGKLARTTVIASSAAGAKVNFNSVPFVAIDALAEDLQIFNAAVVEFGSNVVPTFVAPVVTTATAASTSSPNITVPAGVVSQLFLGQNIASAVITGGQDFTIIGIAGTTVTMSGNAVAVGTNTPITFGLQRYDLTSSILANTGGFQIGLFGAAAVGNGNWTGLYDGPGRFSSGNGTGPGIGCVQAISLNGGRAGMFYSRSSDSVGSGLPGVETLVVVGVVDTAEGAVQSNWTQYSEGNVLVSGPANTNDIYLVHEIDLASLWTTATADPYSVNNTGHTSTLRVTAGKGFGAGSNNITSAFEIINNGAKYEAGILVHNIALDTTVTMGTVGVGNVMLMPDSVGFTWSDGSGSFEGQIYCKVTGGFPVMFVNMATNGALNYNFNGAQVLGLNASAFFPTSNKSYQLGGINNNFGALFSAIVSFPGQTMATLLASMGTPFVGLVACITDGSTNTYGATVTGGGADKVLIWFNGTNWTVMGS